MKEQKYCHICGGKIKEGVEICKKCYADPSETIIVDCRAARYSNAVIISAYVNLVLTNLRLIAFMDIKGSIAAGVQSGLASQGGIIGAVAASTADKPTERVVAKGLNGAIKFEAPLSSITGVETENTKRGVHTFINTSNSKPLRVVLGTSFDGAITGDMFRETLINTACPQQ